MQCRFHLPLLPSELEKEFALLHGSGSHRTETKYKALPQSPTAPEQGKRETVGFDKTSASFVLIKTSVSAEPGSFIQQTILCAFSVPCTWAGTSQFSSRFSMLRKARNSPIWDKRHSSEQSLRKWFGFSEHPGVFGFQSQEERTSGSGREASSETRKPRGGSSPETGRITQTQMNSEWKLSSSSWLAHYNEDLRTLSSVLNPRQGD